MSVALHDMPPHTIKRPRGRRPVAESETARQNHIRCAALLLLSAPYRTPVKRIAQAFGVSERTVYNWRDAALTYDDPEAEGLRRWLAN